MVALARFLLKSYTRKHAYFAPLAGTLIAMFLLYSYKPNPVMDSYAVTSVFLFIGASWTGLTFLNHGSPQQEQLHIIHIGSMRRYMFSQLLAMLIPIVLFAILFIVYPILTHMFGEPVRLQQLFQATCGHLVMGMLGIMLSLFFQRAWMPNGTQATALLLILVIVSIGAKPIIAILPISLAWLHWLLPPVSPIMDGLLNSSKSAPGEVWGMIGWSLIYILLLGVAYMAISIRRDART
ncbi:hypothetical protein GRF59_07365 [Paenibacillus sp. HJL G12]|uniref:Uncharacterized protein n=1 Tax=Paenibacillus dendrobii TaxID=2691084 RepID=A0A7X3IGD0_9BACL|nr:hypothetical protein [Paenibacillus dendrobii]MWV43449.1 hypothetical protein [Paenibacillus dendrobii]